jgi:hypothetical protein
MKFSKDDFAGDVVVRIQCIILNQMGLNCLGSFKDLELSKRNKFNRFLNEYVSKLPENDWELKVLNDFNLIMSEEVFTQDFKPQDQYVYHETKEALMTPEQEQFVLTELNETPELFKKKMLGAQTK